MVYLVKKKEDIFNKYIHYDQNCKFGQWDITQVGGKKLSLKWRYVTVN